MQHKRYCGGSPVATSLLVPRVKRSGHPGMSGCITIRLRKSSKRIGLEYWKRLGWDCQSWVDILENFQSQQYRGDTFHPTDRRLQQAQNFCEWSEIKTF